MSLCVCLCVKHLMINEEFVMNLIESRKDKDIEDVDHIIITDKIKDIIIPDFLLKFRVNTAMTAPVKQNKDLDINP